MTGQKLWQGDVMFSRLSRLSIRNRIWLIVTILVGSVVLGALLDGLALRDALWRERELQTQSLVVSGHDVMQHFHALQLDGTLSAADAQRSAISAVRAMRRSDSEYLWIADMSGKDPKVVMHPLLPTLEGRLLDASRFTFVPDLRSLPDPSQAPTYGTQDMQATLRALAEQGGEGYLSYVWPRSASSSDLPSNLYPKLSYVRNMAPWNWVIGSGIFIEDVDAAIWKQTSTTVLRTGIAGIVLLLLASLVARSITLPLKRSSRAMRGIGAPWGKAERLPVEGPGELAELATGFNRMLDELELHEAAQAQREQHLEDAVARRTAELEDANRQLESELAERQLAEQALRDSQARFSNICTTAQDAIFLIDEQRRVSYWNPAAVRIYGFSADEVLGRDVVEFVIPERLRDWASAEFSEFIESDEYKRNGRQHEVTGRSRDGREFPASLSVSAIRLNGSWSAVCFVRDISEQKQSSQAVRESRARMRALLDASSESVLLLNPEGRILEINTCAAQRFNLTPEVMSGQNFFDYLPTALVVPRRAAMQQVVISGEPTHLNDRRDGRFFDNNLYPVKDDSGRVESVAIYARDTTEHERNSAIEATFNRMDNLLLQQRTELAAIARVFCQRIVPVFDFVGAWIGRAEKDGRLTVLATSDTEAGGALESLSKAALRWDDAPHCHPASMVMRSGEPGIVDFAESGCHGCEGSIHDLGAGESILLPLILRGKPWGVLTLYSRRSGQFRHANTLQVLKGLADRVGVSLESATQQEWLTLLNTALANVANAAYITDGSGTILWGNRALSTLSGFTEAEILGANPMIFSTKEDNPDFHLRFRDSISAGKTWHGELINTHSKGTRYTVDQTITPLLDTTGKVTHYVAILEDITERKNNEERMRHTAHHDPLTDLPNRGLFLDRLGQALALARREARSGALMFLDLDHFKAVNDRLGHAAGDALLIAVAERLQAQVRESDTVARLGGDEFTIILPSLREPGDADMLADKILHALSQPLTIEGEAIHIGASIGIARFPESGCTIEALLRAADDAMYAAKRSGRNRHMAAVGADTPA
ncbi:hypothetical protein CEW87_15790 [Parazoarcus communis]|uniref:Sensor domain-containing diguanylate cyclase n=1 Tax=Parazoarcus communis TaxID=41977 RepID=A0A2U8H451_9RHOO|nr:hypothetical protein CEW87_15790 [Parazoarcus communis]